MKLLLTVLQFVRMDLEGLYADLDRAEATLKAVKKATTGSLAWQIMSKT